MALRSAASTAVAGWKYEHVLVNSTACFFHDGNRCRTRHPVIDLVQTTSERLHALDRFSSTPNASPRILVRWTREITPSRRTLVILVDCRMIRKRLLRQNEYEVAAWFKFSVTSQIKVLRAINSAVKHVVVVPVIIAGSPSDLYQDVASFCGKLGTLNVPVKTKRTNRRTDNIAIVFSSRVLRPSAVNALQPAALNEMRDFLIELHKTSVAQADAEFAALHQHQFFVEADSLATKFERSFTMGDGDPSPDTATPVLDEVSLSVLMRSINDGASRANKWHELGWIIRPAFSSDYDDKVNLKDRYLDPFALYYLHPAFMAMQRTDRIRFGCVGKSCFTTDWMEKKDCTLLNVHQALSEKVQQENLTKEDKNKWWLWNRLWSKEDYDFSFLEIRSADRIHSAKTEKGTISNVLDEFVHTTVIPWMNLDFSTDGTDDKNIFGRLVENHRDLYHGLACRQIVPSLATIVVRLAQNRDESTYAMENVSGSPHSGQFVGMNIETGVEKTSTNTNVVCVIREAQKTKKGWDYVTYKYQSDLPSYGESSDSNNAKMAEQEGRSNPYSRLFDPSFKPLPLDNYAQDIQKTKLPEGPRRYKKTFETVSAAFVQFIPTGTVRLSTGRFTKTLLKELRELPVYDETKAQSSEFTGSANARSNIEKIASKYEARLKSKLDIIDDVNYELDEDEEFAQSNRLLIRRKKSGDGDNNVDNMDVDMPGGADGEIAMEPEEDEDDEASEEVENDDVDIRGDLAEDIRRLRLYFEEPPSKNPTPDIKGYCLSFEIPQLNFSPYVENSTYAYRIQRCTEDPGATVAAECEKVHEVFADPDAISPKSVGMQVDVSEAVTADSVIVSTVVKEEPKTAAGKREKVTRTEMVTNAMKDAKSRYHDVENVFPSLQIPSMAPDDWAVNVTQFTAVSTGPAFQIPPFELSELNTINQTFAQEIKKFFSDDAKKKLQNIEQFKVKELLDFLRLDQYYTQYTKKTHSFANDTGSLDYMAKVHCATMPYEGNFYRGKDLPLMSCSRFEAASGLTPFNNAMAKRYKTHRRSLMDAVITMHLRECYPLGQIRSSLLWVAYPDQKSLYFAATLEDGSTMLACRRNVSTDVVASTLSALDMAPDFDYNALHLYQIPYGWEGLQKEILDGKSLAFTCQSNSNRQIFYVCPTNTPLPLPSFNITCNGQQRTIVLTLGSEVDYYAQATAVSEMMYWLVGFSHHLYNHSSVEFCLGDAEKIPDHLASVLKMANNSVKSESMETTSASAVLPLPVRALMHLDSCFDTSPFHARILTSNFEIIHGLTESITAANSRLDRFVEYCRHALGEAKTSAVISNWFSYSDQLQAARRLVLDYPTIVYLQPVEFQYPVGSEQMLLDRISPDNLLLETEEQRQNPRRACMRHNAARADDFKHSGRRRIFVKTAVAMRPDKADATPFSLAGDLNSNAPPSLPMGFKWDSSNTMVEDVYPHQLVYKQAEIQVSGTGEVSWLTVAHAARALQNGWTLAESDRLVNAFHKTASEKNNLQFLQLLAPLRSTVNGLSKVVFKTLFPYRNIFGIFDQEREATSSGKPVERRSSWRLIAKVPWKSVLELNELIDIGDQFLEYILYELQTGPEILYKCDFQLPLDSDCLKDRVQQALIWGCTYDETSKSYLDPFSFEPFLANIAEVYDRWLNWAHVIWAAVAHSDFWEFVFDLPCKLAVEKVGEYLNNNTQLTAEYFQQRSKLITTFNDPDTHWPGFVLLIMVKIYEALSSLPIEDIDTPTFQTVLEDPNVKPVTAQAIDLMEQWIGVSKTASVYQGLRKLLLRLECGLQDQRLNSAACSEAVHNVGRFYVEMAVQQLALPESSSIDMNDEFLYQRVVRGIKLTNFDDLDAAALIPNREGKKPKDGIFLLRAVKSVDDYAFNYMHLKEPKASVESYIKQVSSDFPSLKAMELMSSHQLRGKVFLATRKVRDGSAERLYTRYGELPLDKQNDFIRIINPELVQYEQGANAAEEEEDEESDEDDEDFSDNEEEDEDDDSDEDEGGNEGDEDEDEYSDSMDM